MAMRYGAITSRRGTRREIGRMSAAGDQGEAQRAWQEVEKRDKTGVATRGANRGARRGRERDFHNIAAWMLACAGHSKGMAAGDLELNEVS